jgi:hypothetical protein
MPALMRKGAAAFLPGTHEIPEYAWVYLLIGENDSGGFMKIGCSSQPLRRWKDLAVSPVSDKYMPDVKYAAIWRAENSKDSYRVETLLHHRFRDRRIEGEWFRFDFKALADKREFNDGCKKILTRGWWEKFNFTVARNFC